MSSTINASTASGGGLVTSADASGILQLQTAGTTAVTIDASQNVGIGTSSPSAPLDIKVGTGNFTVGLQGAANAQLTASGTLRFNTTAGTTVFAQNTIESVRIDSSGNVGIGTSSPATKLHLLTPSAANVELRIGNSLSYSSLLIDSAGDSRLYTPALNQIFSVNSAERMRIDSSGNVGIGTSSPTAGVRLDVRAAACVSTLTSTSGTNSVYTQMLNSSGNFLLGTDDSAGGVTGTAYSRFVYGNGAYPMVFLTNSNERMRIDSSGNLLVGTTTQVESCRLSLYGGSIGGLGFASSLVSNKYSVNIDSAGGLTTRKDSVDYWYLGRSGSLNCVSSGGSWLNSSDERLKDNIETLPNALKNVLKLRGVSFMRKATQQQEIGVIAQEVKRIYPEVVEDSGGMLGVNYGALVGPLIEAIKELKAIIDTQNARIDALEAK